MEHVNDLSKSILSFTDQRCILQVVYAGTENDLRKKRVTPPTKNKKKSIAYINPFSGIDIKVKSIGRILSELPLNATLLWTDASVLILNNLNLNILSNLENFDMLFIRERQGVDRLNLGVILMRNTLNVQLLFNKTVSFVQQGYWDQGIISCALGSKLGPKALESNCTNIGIKKNNQINWSFLPDAFSMTAKVTAVGTCKQKLSEIAPVFLKFTGDKLRRFKCFKEFKRCLNETYGFTHISSSNKTRISYDSAVDRCIH